MDRRQALLEELVALARAPDDIARELAALPWDVEAPLVRLSAAHVGAVLERYHDGALEAAAVETWADALESRDDVETEPAVQDILVELANPALHGPLTLERAGELLRALARL